MLLKGADLSASFRDDNKHIMSAIDLIALYVPQPLQLLKEIFNSYIVIKSKNVILLNDPRCEIEINFDLLIPRGVEHKQMPVLATLLKSGRTNLQNPLLLHPLVESFLCLKWQKLKIFFWLLICLHSTFTCSLTFVGYIRYAKPSTNETILCDYKENFITAGNISLGVSLLFLIFIVSIVILFIS
jgi:hypothetical protein